jgi:hypothetical protein
METTDFYKALTANSIPLRDLLINKSFFAAIPADWHVVVVDVKDPSIGLGNYHNDVNLVVTGSIITVLNTIKSISKQTEIPYFFRGNGATFIIPESNLNTVLVALENYKRHVLKNLVLTIKVGNIIIKDVYASGATIGIAKLQLNNYLVTPVISGNGLKIAERTIMENLKEEIKSSDGVLAIDLQGMECRWDEIFPDEQEKKVICLLVLCKKELMQAEVFTKILDEIDYVFGDLNKRRPITTDTLKLDNSFRKMRTEMYARLGKFDRGYLVQNWLITYFGKYYFKFFKGGKDYLFRVTQLSDTIVLDGSINTVFSGTERQMNTLKLSLDALEADGKIHYGIHATYASIMSCFIEDREENHIHFVDGTEGGYTTAALHLKNKLKQLDEHFYK